MSHKQLIPPPLTLHAQGVSYFDVTRLEWVMDMAGVTPIVNQYHIAVGLADTVHHNITRVKSFCSSVAPPIHLEAFSTLSGGCMELATVRSIAEVHNVSAAMVCLRWIVQQNMTVAVSSDETAFDREDLAAASTTNARLVLSDEEMSKLSALGGSSTSRSANA
jgi:diketogulonate reductase-like aldo/keto reductase